MKAAQVRTFTTIALEGKDEQQVYDSAYIRGFNAGYDEFKRQQEEEQQQRLAARRRQRRREEAKKRMLIYYAKQKAIGFLLAAVGVASIFIDWDGTAAVFIVPMGLYLMFTKHKCIYE